MAVDWLPAIVLLAAFSNMIRPASFRAVAVLVLAAFVPLRLLWGSVYFRTDHLNAFFMLCVAAGFAVLAVSLLFVEEVPQKRMSWKTFVWGASIAVTAVTIASTESLTCGAATGVCGVATLGVLLSASRIPNLAAFPIVCLIELSTSYSELPVLTSGLLLFAWLSLLTVERITSDRRVSFTRAAVVSALLLAGSVTFMQLKESQGTVGRSGPESLPYGAERSGGPPGEMVPPEVSAESATGISAAESKSDSGTSNADDPFDGLSAE